jgi:hypothetical protein
MLFNKIFLKIKSILIYLKKFFPSRLNELIERIFKDEEPYTFKGWQMTTCQAIPWGEDNEENFLIQTNNAIKKNFSFTISHRRAMMDQLLWRHWNVSYAIRHAIEFIEKKDLEFVECGVADGITCYFAISELRRQLKMGKINKFHMHLYDSWGPMRAQELTGDEVRMVDKYEGLSLERTKKNLSKFNDDIIYHQGYIPESLTMTPPPPNSIAYLHIDLNSAKPTLGVLEFYFPRLLKGGVILFDDYGWKGYEESKEKIKEFFEDKPGILLLMPTGQAIYYR